MPDGFAGCQASIVIQVAPSTKSGKFGHDIESVFTVIYCVRSFSRRTWRVTDTPLAPQAP